MNMKAPTDPTVSLNPRLEIISKYFDFKHRISPVTRRMEPKLDSKIKELTGKYMLMDKPEYEYLCDHLDSALEKHIGDVSTYRQSARNDLIYILNFLQDDAHEYMKGVIINDKEDETEELQEEFVHIDASYLGNPGSSTLADVYEDELIDEFEDIGRLKPVITDWKEDEELRVKKMREGELTEKEMVDLRLSIGVNVYEAKIECKSLIEDILNYLDQNYITKKYPFTEKDIKNKPKRLISNQYKINQTTSIYNFVQSELIDITPINKKSIHKFIGWLLSFTGIGMIHYEDEYNLNKGKKERYKDYDEYLRDNIKNWIKNPKET